MATGKRPYSDNPGSGMSPFSDLDIHLFKEGTHFKLYEKLGAQRMVHGGIEGVAFSVWAPNAKHVSVIGDFNAWNPNAHVMKPRWDESGLWELFVPDAQRGMTYKFAITPKRGRTIEKGDPFAFAWEIPPKTASVIWDLDYEWGDGEWMNRRKSANALGAPISIYELHLGSWRRVPEEGNRSLSYREIAYALARYVKDMGYTHVELLPVTEHPFFGSWGYQTLGFFAPTSRYGTPQDFMFFIDHLHQEGIGVILDWVPSHFPADSYGLSQFDGTHLYEHADMRKGYHPDWNSYIFNYGRNEVREFLISSACFWLDRYHVDGIRVDAVASMLYLDYSRKKGEWIPNHYGGNENLESITFLRTLNEVIYADFPDVQTFAEESTAWPMVSRPTYVGGLGFGLKWNMGWMHDTLQYFQREPIFRKHHHHQLTFSLWYAFNENFILPVSHDEVVHGKGSLYGKMAGDEWQKFANLRLFLGYMFAHPGKKLLFMGCDYGQWGEWNHDGSLDWDVLRFGNHSGIQHWVRDLNGLYRSEGPLHAVDFSPEGFEWIEVDDRANSVLSFLRKDPQGGRMILVVCNFTPVPRGGYRIGVPLEGAWEELLNSDALPYGGTGHGNFGKVESTNIPSHGRPFSLELTLPPLGVLFLRPAQSTR